MLVMYGKHIKYVFFLVALLSIAGYGQATTPGEPSESSSNRNENYRIGPGDVIDVVVTGVPTLSRTGIRVSNQGRIQLPMIDEEVPTACTTERELAEQIRERYKKFVLTPSVIVAVKEFNSNPVAVIGAVTAPGRFQVQRPMKILELLTFVNGVSDKAGSNVEIIRNRGIPYCEGPKFIVSEAAGDELISINLSDTLRGNDEANPYVRAGDIVRVGEADKTQAYVTGTVTKPGIISLDQPVTLTQAIAMSGGLASGAQAEKIMIRRQISGSVNRSELVVSLKEINQRKRDDLLLRPNDIIEVAGPGKLTTFFRSFVPSLTQIPFRVIP